MFNITPASNMTDNRTSVMYHINKLVKQLLNKILLCVLWSVIKENE